MTLEKRGVLHWIPASYVCTRQLTKLALRLYSAIYGSTEKTVHRHDTGPVFLSTVPFSASTYTDVKTIENPHMQHKTTSEVHLQQECTALSYSISSRMAQHLQN